MRQRAEAPVGKHAAGASDERLIALGQRDGDERVFARGLLLVVPRIAGTATGVATAVPNGPAGISSSGVIAGTVPYSLTEVVNVT
jgi:hypothetical protein